MDVSTKVMPAVVSHLLELRCSSSALLLRLLQHLRLSH